MDSAGRRRSPDTVQRLLRIWLWINDALILASSAIVTGILAHFIRKYHERGTHVIFEEVIAVVTLFLYLFAIFAPALKGYRGYLLPLNLALSYLWLTNLIFSSQDYSGHRCHYYSPAISLLSNVVADSLMWYRCCGSSPGTAGGRVGNGEKGSAPLTSTPGATTGAPTAPDAANGTRV
ncbi:hypothetical protein NEUTE1DRAFT_124309 [Neurospora tetrasperma FGSC 2508]|uniref:MARVEL domain-containing protein n=1 Tax=Neurospora tetrasperma (strain FGSC 2508 / ATCC MYA-4615 / P0657) TaxID=510951 RepID=F8MV97_NEUT8|nr:uncharacterized protein NEUTE1DRAFT_124309 [Neurospora tetrasperma FGSC 2508]EGO53902.1 hypothetical protein NEUTE1DRAFT_124309 [Neurospora tetrasperma FGSC 2508]EGZ68686.1 hypothetical protein NEUTE2DRAFT_118731 [Neurospora tetrasperma FGSC 2509]